MEGSGCGMIEVTIPDFFLEGLRKTTKNLSQDSHSPGRDLNLGSP
jgi:hypothetical protein